MSTRKRTKTEHCRGEQLGTNGDGCGSLVAQHFAQQGSFLELRQFISATLTDIIGGIADAQAQIGDLASDSNQGAINPGWDTLSMNHIQVVDFDVAVTATDQASAGGKAGIKVWALEAGAHGEKAITNSSVSRISFKVPILAPRHYVYHEPPKGYRLGD